MTARDLAAWAELNVPAPPLRLLPGFRDLYTPEEWRERWLLEARMAVSFARSARLYPDPRFDGLSNPSYVAARWLNVAARARAMLGVRRPALVEWKP